MSVLRNEMCVKSTGKGKLTGKPNKMDVCTPYCITGLCIQAIRLAKTTELSYIVHRGCKPCTVHCSAGTRMSYTRCILFTGIVILAIF